MTFIIKNKKKLITKFLVITVWIGLWQCVYEFVNQEILLVSPFGVLKTICRLSVQGDFWSTIVCSFLRIMAGYLVGIAVGTVIAAFTAAIPIIHTFLYPAISSIKATPVASFIILALLWMNTGMVPAFISFLMVFPITWTNVLEGIKQTDKKLLEMAEVFHFSVLKKIMLIYIPSVVPYFAASCTVSLGLAWKSGIAAEVISSPKLSIGSQLYNAKVYLETAELFAWSAVVILLSVVLEKIFLYIMKKLELRYF